MKKKFYFLLILFIIILSFVFENKLPEIKISSSSNSGETKTDNPILKEEVIVENNSENITNLELPSKSSGEINKITQEIKNIPETLNNFKYQIKTTNNIKYSSNINLPVSSEYNLVEGITTFRGNNYRDSASYGTVEIKENKLKKVWINVIGQTDNWTGVGWNGQPAIIKWDKSLQKQMNIYEEFKNKESFTEVIYGALDNKIHFYDLETGKPSRDVIEVPSSIKGSVTIDPRGYPLLYVGQGIDKVSGETVPMGYHIFSLIDGSELLFIDGRDTFAYSNWGAFDGNPIIDANSDTLILPGENGLIYIIKLNTNFDKINGKISIKPDITRYRYTKDGRSGGAENSIAIFKNYAFFINNNGVLQCLDLNTLTPMWTYQMEDDCDATLALEVENDNLVLYASCEVDKRQENSPAFIKKIDASTGKVLWQYSCICQYDALVNGGVLSSPVVGKNNLSDIVIFNFSKTSDLKKGKMVALNKSNGNIIWEKDLNNYSWSSPVDVYTKQGDGYIIFCDSVGQIHLIDGKTGEILNVLQTGGGNIEGSPAIFENQIIIGTRGKKIFRIDIK